MGIISTRRIALVAGGIAVHMIAFSGIYLVKTTPIVTMIQERINGKPVSGTPDSDVEKTPVAIPQPSTCGPDCPHLKNRLMPVLVPPR